MHRRDFLDPLHVAHAAVPLLHLGDAVPSPALVYDEVALLRLGSRAMATTFEVVLPFEAPEAQPAGREAFELLDALEAQMTVYRDTSEISRLNRLAWRKPVRVESRLFDLLDLARHIHEQTHGAFDITTGALIRAWGFFRGPRRQCLRTMNGPRR